MTCHKRPSVFSLSVWVFVLSWLFGYKLQGLQDLHSNIIGQFRVASSLCIKAKIRTKPLIWKLMFILIHIKLIFTRKVLHLSLVLKVRDFGTRKWPIRWFFDGEMFLHCYFLQIFFKIQTSQLDIFAIYKQNFKHIDYNSLLRLPSILKDPTIF